MTETIDVYTLRDMFVGAARNLALHEEEINAHNVFPVPDGDTGTNMTATASAAAQDLLSLPSDKMTADGFAKVLTGSSLRGARGNSGVILSQIYAGFACVLRETAGSMTPASFAKALTEASRVAYGAVDNPKEGTMLTVMRAIAEAATRLSSEKDICFERLLAEINDCGNDTLSRTPDMLPVLKKAGVVDAGGMGLMRVFEAFSIVLNGGEIADVSSKESAEKKEIEFTADVHDLDEIDYGYCTEFFVKNLRESATLADIDKLRERLSKIGNSLICIGDLDLVKVHVHTNDPGRALSYAVELGELDRVKIENMLEQNRKIRAEVAKRKKPIGLVSVCVGSGICEIFKELTVDAIVEGGQTMNPSVQEILSAINRVNADCVIVLPNNKNIVMAAEKAKELAIHRCVVLETENVAEGIAAAVAFDPQAEVEANVSAMTEAYRAITYAQVTTAVRDTEMDGFSIAEGDVIGLSDKRILVKGKDANEVAVELVGKMKMAERDVLNIYAGEGVSEGQVEALVERFGEEYPDLEVISYMGNQPHSFYILAAE